MVRVVSNEAGNNAEEEDGVIMINDDACSSTTNNAPDSSAAFQIPDTSLPRFNDIIGHGHVKLRIEEVLLPLALPIAVTNAILKGVRSMPASIMLTGPPGTGKTLLGQAIAGEAAAAFIPVGPSDILSKYVGESEASVRALFKRGKQTKWSSFAGMMYCSTSPPQN